MHLRFYHNIRAISYIYIYYEHFLKYNLCVFVKRFAHERMHAVCMSAYVKSDYECNVRFMNVISSMKAFGYGMLEAESA